MAELGDNQECGGQNYWKARQSYQRWGQNYWKARQSYQSRGQNYWKARQSYERRGQNYWKAHQSYQRRGQNYWKARQSYQRRGQNYWNARQSYELRGHNSETSATANRRYESSPPKDKRIQRHAVSIRNGLLRNFAAAATSRTGFYVYWKRSCPGLPHFFWRPARTQELLSGGSGEYSCSSKN